MPPKGPAVDEGADRSGLKWSARGIVCVIAQKRFDRIDRDIRCSRCVHNAAAFPRPMIIKQLAHLCFYTNQLDTMVAFYRDVLGFPVRFTMRTDDGFEFGYYFATGQTTFIEIFDQAGAVKQWGGDLSPRKPNDGVRYGHFCLEVLGLDEAVAELRAKGVEVRNIKTGVDHSRQAWITDPDGNSIELMEYTPKSLQLTG